jgi:alkyldihydroxyacetonephosphate synthase
VPDDIRSMKWWGWGDEGTEFQIDNRPDLWPYIRASLNLPDDRPHSPRVAFDSVRVPEQKINRAFLDEVTERLGSSRVRDDKSERLTHAFGKSFRDLWRMRHGAVNYAPDCVLYPETSDEVSAVVASAVRHQVGVIPFGGGTNIAGCLEPIGSRDRMTVSVDMRRMNRLLKLDGESETARFQAGVLGPDVESQLNRSGFTLGHFPDSFRYSTLGGWVATRSAGMQSDRYGKIEDIVLSLKMVTPAGLIETLAVPRASSGIDINRLCIGSEGAFGIITEVVVNVHRMPERKGTFGYLFSDFQSGLRALHRCHREGCVPAMARLNDPKKTALSFAFKTAQGATQRQVGRLVKSYLKHIRRMKLDQACLMLVSFEGSQEAFERDRSRAGAIFQQLGAFGLGGAPGRAFQAGKFDFPHLRDFLWDRGVLTDVSETATVWSNILPVYQAATSSIEAAMAAHCRTGWVGCHISHTYHAGASLYFTFGLVPNPGDDLAQYLRVKKAAEDAFLANGATLSHHHAVGYEHLPWLEREISPTGLKAIQSLKHGLDPCDLFNSGKFQSGYGFTDWGLPDDGDKPQ